MEKNKWNPWFGEFWESYFNCKMPTKNNEENKEGKTIVCDQSNKISKDNGKQLLIELWYTNFVNFIIYYIYIETMVYPFLIF